MVNVYFVYLSHNNNKINKRYVLSELSKEEVLSKLMLPNHQIEVIKLTDIHEGNVRDIPFTLVS